ncbi:MAG: FAD-binding oxidoreductase, partial [Verrucomicrobiota bacterium]|nr:FAD-binding oxidoreductase [Verrucomicrobiota bacterium]
MLFAEHGHRTAIFADEIGQRTTSAAAAAIWFPYDTGLSGRVIRWALATFNVLAELAADPRCGVSIIELRHCSRSERIQIPQWAAQLGASSISPGVFPSAFQMNVPLMDTTIYLAYLARRFRDAGGKLHDNIRFEKLEDVDSTFDLVINCAGIGARKLAHDPTLEPHRGQVAIV